MEKVKKNRVLRFAFIALMFTLVSGILMMGTLAKYVTTGSGSDTARVAKWGVAVDASSADGLFKTEYAKDDSSYTLTANSVVAASKVVAPGTSGTLTDVAITGTPEVACRIAFNVDATNSVLAGWVDSNGVAYEPIVWTLTGPSGVIATDGTFADLLAKLNAVSVDVAPGTDLSTVGMGSYVIGWSWPFSTSSANDVNDTFLGNLTTAPTITLAFDVTVTQID